MAKPKFPFCTGHNLKQKYVIIWGAFRGDGIRVHRDHLLSLAKSLRGIHRLFQSSQPSLSQASSLSCVSSKKGKQRSAPGRLSKRGQKKPEKESRSRGKL